MYNPQGNDIWVPLGIQNFPIYQEDSIPALTYGSLGMVLGHELTHGFDSTGALFDKDGNLRVIFQHLIILSRSLKVDHRTYFIESRGSCYF